MTENQIIDDVKIGRDCSTVGLNAVADEWRLLTF